MGSVTQIRVLGGTIGLAICSALLNNHITRETSKFLTAEQVTRLLESFQSVAHLPAETQVRIRSVYAVGYNEQMRAMLYFCLASLVALVLVVERKPKRMETTEDGEIARPT